MMVPVVLFAYNRCNVLEQTLACLRENGVPRLIVYSDAPKSATDIAGVRDVREALSCIDWCEVERHDRDENLGLGRNILLGVSETLLRHEAVLVWEDDLVCVPGTYGYLSAALAHYRDDKRVMSVTGWTSRYLVPGGVRDEPYFDGRAECWVWGTWRRAWQGMTAETALDKMRAITDRGERPDAYGGDLPYMAKREQDRNIWAVRFIYHHILHKGLCLRPPWSMVEHIGFDERASNTVGTGGWLKNGTLRPCPLIPAVWPDPVENMGCARLHRKMCPRPWSDVFPGAVRGVRQLLANVKGR